MNNEQPTESKKQIFISYVKNKIEKLKKLVGIVDKKVVISFKLSEFMQEVDLALENLPTKYKELYKLKPVEGELFINRDKEIEALEKSFDNWTKDRFVTCALIGEKGCGITSTLNVFLEKIPKTDTIHVELKEKIHTKDKYFAFFNDLLQTKDMKSNEELIDFLNNLENPKIIIMENLHHMFLKIVGGFESMEMLFELISHTTKNVFWIGAFTPQTWNYLEKIISISNYFTREIIMHKLGDEIIKNIIFKRIDHESTKLQFIPNAETLESRTFDKLDKEERQPYLEEQYFTLLHKLSNGNVSLALLYWIRSISMTDEKTLEIKEIDDFDYSFIKNFSSEILFTMQALILHDGLRVGDLDIVMDELARESNRLLIPMLEQGLLIQPNEKYNINPAIYKPVYDYLSSKNFIH